MSVPTGTDQRAGRGGEEECARLTPVPLPWPISPAHPLCCPAHACPGHSGCRGGGGVQGMNSTRSPGRGWASPGSASHVSSELCDPGRLLNLSVPPPLTCEPCPHGWPGERTAMPRVTHLERAGAQQALGGHSLHAPSYPRQVRGASSAASGEPGGHLLPTPARAPVTARTPCADRTASVSLDK